MRSDKKKGLDKVAAVIAVDPLASQTEITKKTGLSVGNVNAKLKELETVKDERIINLTDVDLEIVIKAQGIISEKLNNKSLVKKMNIKDVSMVAKDSATRYALFKGDVTDKDGGLRAGIVLLPPIDDK